MSADVSATGAMPEPGGADEDETTGPLAGLRVVELGVWVAAPGAGGVLADWGADVIKVEPPGGDPLRQVYASYGGAERPDNPQFDLDNRGKRSVALDLRSDDNRATMESLLKWADVFVTNVRPAGLARLGLEPDAVRSRHEGLVYAIVTGFGRGGDEDDRAGYDVGAFWARSGLASSMVPDGEAPRPSPPGLGDHVTGLAAVAGILAALVERERTGFGQVVDASLLRTGLYAMGWEHSMQLRHGRVPRALPRTETVNPLWNVYAAGDGTWFWLLGMESDRHWPTLTKAIGRSALADDPRFRDARARREHAGELVEVLDEVFATASRQEWSERFAYHDVWWAPVMTPEDIASDSHVEAIGGFVDVPGAGGAPGHRSIASPVSFGAGAPKRGVPALGEHTDEIRAELPPRA